MRIITTKVKINGLYEWGRGWVSNDAYQKWNDFWRNELLNDPPSFWSFHEHDRAQYLVYIGCAIYLHPMDFTVTMEQIGRSGTYKDGVFVEEFPAIRSLKEILERMVDYIGDCSYTMSPVQKHEFEVKYE